MASARVPEQGHDFGWLEFYWKAALSCQVDTPALRPLYLPCRLCLQVLSDLPIGSPVRLETLKREATSIASASVTSMRINQALDLVERWWRSPGVTASLTGAALQARDKWSPVVASACQDGDVH